MFQPINRTICGEKILFENLRFLDLHRLAGKLGFLEVYDTNGGTLMNLLTFVYKDMTWGFQMCARTFFIPPTLTGHSFAAP